MKYGIVRPRDRLFTVIDVPDDSDCCAFHAALDLAGLTRGHVDHSRVGPWVGIIVGELAMFEPLEKQHYFAVGRTLVAGGAIFYSFNEMGETIDYCDAKMPVLWIADSKEAERLIGAGLLARPKMEHDGELFWQWPEPMPVLEEWTKMMQTKGKI